LIFPACAVRLTGMKTASVRQIQRHFRDVLSWVEDGEEVAITSNRRVVARLVPPQSSRLRKIKQPDFAARLKRIYGDMPPLDCNPVLRQREDSR
jgi:antitoxin (DNA-binding transcriptional repressor) of toxin-antitoxin stability system